MFNLMIESAQVPREKPISRCKVDRGFHLAYAPRASQSMATGCQLRERRIFNTMGELKNDAYDPAGNEPCNRVKQHDKPPGMIQTWQYEGQRKEY